MAPPSWSLNPLLSVELSSTSPCKWAGTVEGDFRGAQCLDRFRCEYRSVGGAPDGTLKRGRATAQLRDRLKCCLFGLLLSLSLPAALTAGPTLHVETVAPNHLRATPSSGIELVGSPRGKGGFWAAASKITEEQYAEIMKPPAPPVFSLFFK